MIRRALENELCRRVFWQFCLRYDPEFFNKRPFLKQIADALQKIYTGEIHSLSISMPPRAGKSYTISLFAAWFLGNRSELSVMRNTCTATLYNKFSYDTRAIIRSDCFKEIFPLAQLADDRQNIDGWNLRQSRQCAYFGAGAGGTIIGFGASGLAITDDLYKSLEDALSETVNENVHRWKQSAHDSRLERNCPVIDIGTRWTTRDVIGQGIESGKYELSIVIPALDKNDKSFCEDVKTTEEYLKIRNSIDPQIWQGEYMQAPAELKGLLFKKDELHYFKKDEIKKIHPDAVLSYGDIADEGDDYFSQPIAYIFAPVKKDGRVISPGKIMIPEVIYTQENVDITLPRCAEAILRHDIKYTRIEANGQGSIFIKMLRPLVGNSRVLSVANTQNKNTRILMEYGFIKENVYFLAEGEYELGGEYDRFMRNILGYMKDGSSKHEDAPDSLAGLCKFIQSFLSNLF